MLWSLIAGISLRCAGDVEIGQPGKEPERIAHTHTHREDRQTGEQNRNTKKRERNSRNKGKWRGGTTDYNRFPIKESLWRQSGFHNQCFNCDKSKVEQLKVTVSSTQIQFRNKIEEDI